MAELTKKPEAAEQAEQSQSPEQLNQVREMYHENMKEAQRTGNKDMAKYYKEKLDAVEKQAVASDDSRMGGWEAGYTAYEWRRMASEEYAANGNSVRYRHLISNAEKAED